MNFHTLLSALIKFFAGEAAANSDRIKVTLIGFIGVIITWVAASCPACQGFLTPQAATWISGTIAAYVMSLVHSLGNRDIAAPGETVPGAAVTAPKVP